MYDSIKYKYFLLDNSPENYRLFDRLQNALKAMNEDNESRNSNEISIDIGNLKSKFVRESKHSPVVTFDSEKESCKFINEFNDSVKAKKDETSCCDTTVDWCVATLANSSVVGKVFRKPAENNNVQWPHGENDPKESIENNIGYESTRNTFRNIESTSLVASNIDVTCISDNESYCHSTTGHSELNAVQVKNQIENYKTTLNDKKYV